MCLSFRAEPASPWHSRSSGPAPPSRGTAYFDDRMVGFLPNPVESVCRPLSAEESWPLYYFERHARHCVHCYQPYEVHRSENRLCDRGHVLAQDVVYYFYGKAGQHYSTSIEGGNLVLVEIPDEFVHIKGLLRAMDRTIRIRQGHNLSYDRTYYVPPRTPTGNYSRERRPSASVPPVPQIPSVSRYGLSRLSSAAQDRRPLTPFARQDLEKPSETSSYGGGPSRRRSFHDPDMANRSSSVREKRTSIPDRRHRDSGYFSEERSSTSEERRAGRTRSYEVRPVQVKSKSPATSEKRSRRASGYGVKAVESKKSHRRSGFW